MIFLNVKRSFGVFTAV